MIICVFGTSAAHRFCLSVCLCVHNGPLPMPRVVPLDQLLPLSLDFIYTFTFAQDSNCVAWLELRVPFYQQF